MDFKDKIMDLKHKIMDLKYKIRQEKEQNSIYGAILLGFIAQLFISLMRYEFEEIKHKSTKFIKKSLKNLTLTIKFVKNGLRNYIFANFDKINSLIVTKMGTIT